MKYSVVYVAEIVLALSLAGCADGEQGGRGGAGGFPGASGAASQGGLDDDGDGDGDGDGGDDGGDNGDGTTGGGDDPDDDDAGGDGAKFDTPNGTGGELPEPTYGCAKVDFVFVVDSSASMLDEQENLQASFPQFIAAIEDTLMIEGFHIMVVDTGPQLGLSCETKLGGRRESQRCGPGLRSGKRALRDAGHPQSRRRVFLHGLTG